MNTQQLIVTWQTLDAIESLLSGSAVRYEASQFEKRTIIKHFKQAVENQMKDTCVSSQSNGVIGMLLIRTQQNFERITGKKLFD